MRTLFLDLGSNKGSLACVDDRSVVHLVAIDHRIDDSALMGLIERVVNDAGWTLRDLTHIACVTGPGGFTSLRVGVATANALSDALVIPICGIHLSDLYRERGEGVWMHSTKKKELFIRDSDAEARCIAVDDLPQHLQKGGHWIGELIPDQRSIVEDAGMKEAVLRSLKDVLPEFLKDLEYKKQILQPWYGRGW